MDLIEKQSPFVANEDTFWKKNEKKSMHSLEIARDFIYLFLNTFLAYEDMFWAKWSKMYPFVSTCQTVWKLQIYILSTCMPLLAMFSIEQTKKIIKENPPSAWIYRSSSQFVVA